MAGLQGESQFSMLLKMSQKAVCLWADVTKIETVGLKKRSSGRTLSHDMVVVLSWFGPVLVLVSKNSVNMHLPPKGCVYCNTHISEEYINSTKYMLCLSHFTNIYIYIYTDQFCHMVKDP